MRAILIIYILVASLSLISCSSKIKSSESLKSNEVIEYSERLSLIRTDSCTILTIRDPWQGAEGIHHSFYLVNRGARSLTGVDSNSVVRVPISRIVCMSTTHLAMIKELGEEESIVGASGTSYIYDEVMRSMAEKGDISEIGYEAGLNTEKLVSLSPDLLIMYGIGGESSGYTEKAEELGVRIIYNADYLESDPLGKAEWIKFFGALYCLEQRSDSVFNSIVSAYDSIKNVIASVSRSRPNVLLGLPFRDTWYVSPGNSYISKLIKDAGGKYIWENTHSSFSMPYSFESVFVESMKADLWLNPGAVTAKDEISAFDERLEQLPCFINGRIFNNNSRLSPSGGNDYWESGALKPHIVLKDIASILHPGIFGKYEYFYFRKIE